MMFPRIKYIFKVSAPHRAERDYREMNNDLLEKIVSLQIERQLSLEREAALMELVDFQRKELLRGKSDQKDEIEFTEVVYASPTTSGSSYKGRRLSDGSISPRTVPAPPSAETEEDDVLGYISEGFEALTALLTLSMSTHVLSLSRAPETAETRQIAISHARKISSLVSTFATAAKTLCGRSVRAQSELVTEVTDSFTASSTETLRCFVDSALPSPEHPFELTLRFCGLPDMLTELCRQAWCLGPQSGYCNHVLSRKGDEFATVTLVHPGGDWEDLLRCVFAALKGATLLEGEIFGLLGMAAIRDTWSGEVLDRDVWEEVFRGVDAVEISWETLRRDKFEDETGSIPAEAEIIADDHPGQEDEQLVHDLVGSGESSLFSGDRSPSYGLPEALPKLEPIDEYLATAPGSSEESEEAQKTINRAVDRTELEPGPSAQQSSNCSFWDNLSPAEQQRRGGYKYLRAGEGINASRRASYIASGEDGRCACAVPETPKGPFPFLKRGEGARRSRMIL